MSTTDDDDFVAWGGGNFDYLAVGPSNFGFVTITNGKDPNFNTGVSGGGNVFGVFGFAGLGADDGSVGPARNDYTNSAGVSGTSLQVTGVAGTTDGLYPGVYGQCGKADPPLHLQAGVLGASQHFPGVSGWSGDGVGVAGQSMTDYGVWGTSIRNTGVVGQTGGGFGPSFSNPGNPGKGDVRATPVGVLGTTRESFGVAGTSFKASGVLGQSGAAPAFDPKATNIGGVIGTSRDMAGVVGISQRSFGVSGSSSSNFGVVGLSGTAGPQPPARFGANVVAAVSGSSQGNFGVIGTSQEAVGVIGYSQKSTGVFGQSDNPNNYAGAFVGTVICTGTILGNVKNAIVPFPDGSHRVLHCMESPEHWFEDFGGAQLNRGVARVKLDADFAKVVKPRDYRVFLTAEGDCRGLYVSRKSATDFEVRESQGGASSVRFSYRIVARRRDIKNHKRFAKIDIRIPGRVADKSRRTVKR
jgi:hypothetical protein